LNNNHIDYFRDYSPNSPDLNPLDCVWDELKKAVGSRKPKNLGQLETFCKEEWNSMNERLKYYFHGLVESMPRRLQSVIEAKGFYTKY